MGINVQNTYRTQTTWYKENENQNVKFKMGKGSKWKFLKKSTQMIKII